METQESNTSLSGVAREIVVPEVQPLPKGLIIAGFVAVCLGMVLAAICLVLVIVMASNGSRGGAEVASVIGMVLCGLGMICAFLFAMIVYLVVLYRGWRTLQSLKLLSSSSQLEMPAPGAAVGLLFVPYFNLYWMFPAYMGMEKYGAQLARIRGLEYTGPTASFAKTYAILCIVSAVLFFIPIMWLVLAVMGMMLSLRINDMVAVLGKPFVVSRETC